MLVLRKVKDSDVRVVFDLANDKTYRAFSKNSAQIPFSKHLEWFKTRAIINPYFYIFELNNSPVGIVRFDSADGLDFYVSIVVSVQARGRGCGSQMLKLALSEFKLANFEIKGTVYAEVHRDNAPSRKLFEKNSFTMESDVQDNFIRYKFQGRNV
ncbi:MAG: hypothetical protein CME71_12710 [Halobacteriovorax sp.]|nr:hypothetical protein [Halobacteriovorax sp.]|tara:strand:+ start:471 stop:935 length:465 start_codon:yes stop_codon:yes gene_type:complete